MKGLILAGGSGHRLRPLTHTGPKQLIPIANKPVLFYALEDLKEAGITDIGIVLGLNMPEKIRQTVGDGSRFGVKVTYIMQGEPKGIAHAIKISKNYLKKEPFVVYLGDNLLKNGIIELVEDFKKSKADAVIALSKVSNPGDFGVAELDEDGNVKKLVEKPKRPKTDLALVGIYLFNEKVFGAIKEIKPSWRDELEITDAIQQLIDSDCKVNAHIVKGWWKDTGKPEDILHANQLVLEDLESDIKGKVEKGVTLEGKVRIGEGTVVRAKSTIKGPVVIGKDCKIGPGAHIGPYTSIGDNTTVVNGKIESSVVIGGCFIDCSKKIVNSLIGANSRITSAGKVSQECHTLVLREHSNLKI